MSKQIGKISKNLETGYYWVINKQSILICFKREQRYKIRYYNRENDYWNLGRGRWDSLSWEELYEINTKRILSPKEVYSDT